MSSPFAHHCTGRGHQKIQKNRKIVYFAVFAGQNSFSGNSCATFGHNVFFFAFFCCFFADPFGCALAGQSEWVGSVLRDKNWVGSHKH